MDNPKSRKESSTSIRANEKQGSLASNENGSKPGLKIAKGKYEKSASGKTCWLNHEEGTKSLHQICCDGLLLAFLYFIEREPHVVGSHIYNLIMKQIMKSKYQEIGLCVLIYKLIANSKEMVYK